MHRCSLLVGTGLESEVEARMIVQESERMAAVVLHGEMPFEVQLPQRVGIGIFKAHLGRVLGAFRFINEPRALEYGLDRALGRHVGDPLVLQHSVQHMGTLARMRQPQRDDAVLHLPARAVRTRVRAVRPVLQTVGATLRVPPQRLVPCLATDPHAPTQLTHVRPVSQRQGDKLFPSRHKRPHLPRHGHPPAARFSMPLGVTHQPEQVLPINPVYTSPRERA